MRGASAQIQGPEIMSGARHGDEKPRAWQRMLSGRRLDLLAPSPDDIAIEDIAHGLARVARWNGQTFGDHAFSVAEHAVLVKEIASTLNPQWGHHWQLAALLHDAPEYVVGDLISPFKAAIGFDYKAFENRLLEAIHVRFGLPAILPSEIAAAIKHADRIAAYYEATLLAGFSKDEADRYFGIPAIPESLVALLTRLEASPVATAQQVFLARFAALTQKE
jgi:5'-deoxynucleotidase YfbR-like HD superfamily hydrolase